MKKLGFIGCGNMATAIINGIINSDNSYTNNITVSARTELTLNKIKSQFDVITTLDNKTVVNNCDVLFLCIKPNVYDTVLQEITPLLTNQLIISIVAGKTIEHTHSIIGNHHRFIRTMPNTPSLVNAGMSSITPNDNVTKSDLEFTTQLFNTFGNSDLVPEYLIDAVIGCSGSAPAYVFMFIEAIADTAVSYGMPREQAYKFASTAVMGSAKMVLETQEHPAVLKDKVCSPSGTTIEAVKSLEQNNFRGAVITAVSSCIEKSISLSNAHK